MNNYLEQLKTNVLFDGVMTDELQQMLKCLGAKIKRYQKEDIILLMGEAVTSVGIILSGTVHVIKEDYAGNRMILAKLSNGDIFGEVFAFAEVAHSPITVLAMSECKILYLDFKKMTHSCASACGFHTKLIENMLKLIAVKNLRLNDTIHLLSRRTTREKLIFYFLSQMEKAKGRKLVLPFNRNELADFLCVDRSAMSRELCRMRDQGIIKFHKNNFELLDLTQMKMETGQD